MEAKEHAERVRQARIMELKNTRAWDDLREALEGQAEKFWSNQLAAAKIGKPLDQREIDYARGKLDGIRALLRAPEKAATYMERLTESNEQETS